MSINVHCAGSRGEGLRAELEEAKLDCRGCRELGWWRGSIRALLLLTGSTTPLLCLRDLIHKMKRTVTSSLQCCCED